MSDHGDQRSHDLKPPQLSARYSKKDGVEVVAVGWQSLLVLAFFVALAAGMAIALGPQFFAKAGVVATQPVERTVE